MYFGATSRCVLVPFKQNEHPENVPKEVPAFFQSMFPVKDKWNCLQILQDMQMFPKRHQISIFFGTITSSNHGRALDVAEPSMLKKSMDTALYAYFVFVFFFALS